MVRDIKYFSSNVTKYETSDQMESKIIFCQTEDTNMLPLYATTIGFWEHQAETLRPTGFPDYQIHQIHEGKGELVIQEKRYIVGSGDVFFYSRILRIRMRQSAVSGSCHGFHLMVERPVKCCCTQESANQALQG